MSIAAARSKASVLAGIILGVRHAGDVEGHEFHGNQWTGGGGFKETSGWQKTGSQLGSNKAGVYKTPEGQKYVKFYSNPEQSKTELAAQNVYKEAGVTVPNGQLVQVEGKPAIANDWMASKSLSGSEMEKGLAADPEYAGKVFAASVATQNWDVAGTGFDNIVKTDSGRFAVVDVGGAFRYRAQGGDRPYTSTATEVNTLLNPSVNSWTATAFGKAMSTPAGRASAIATFEKLSKIDPHAPGVTREQWKAKLADGIARVKALGIRHADFNEADHPRDEHGKFESTGGEKAKKAPKAPPVPMHMKEAAYNEVKAGGTFKATAAKYGMTHGQLAGHVWKVDQKKAAIAGAVAAKPAAVTPKTPEAPTFHPGSGLNPSTPSIGVSGKSQTQEAQNKAETVYNTKGTVVYTHESGAAVVKDAATDKYKAFDTNGKLIAETHSFGLAQTKAIESAPLPKSEASLPQTPSKAFGSVSGKSEEPKSWSQMTGEQKMALATKEGYTWKEKTYGPKSGQYAWFDKSGTQVSSPFADKTAHREALDTIHQGKGIAPPVSSAPTPGWPISNDVERTAGSNYPSQVSKAAAGWAKSLSDSEKNAISAYTGSYYHVINRGLREGFTSGEQKEKNYAASISSALSKAPTPPPPELIWRGVGTKTLKDLQKQNYLATGAVVKLNGFQSTSISPSFAAGWKEGALLEIKPAKGGGYVRSMSQHTSEKEYLLPHGAKYTVRGVREIKIEGHLNKYKVIQLEMHAHG